MYWLKQCPKCNGDLTTGSDQYGEYVSCMQCGLCKDTQTETILRQSVDQKPDKLPIVAALNDEAYRIPALLPQTDLTQLAVPA
jgi:DNA-directed RNA polymerase subunit M/transcription elongation factor TFIIS